MSDDARKPEHGPEPVSTAFAYEDSKFARQFVDRIQKQIADGVPQATLGTSLKGGQDFHQVGASALRTLVSWGLTPDDVCVDYGCGSLRIGLHLMQYLQPGNYWGLDVTSQFYEAGLEKIDDAVLAARRPNLRVIDRDSLEEARAAMPTCMLCVGVVSHIPPEEIELFFKNTFFVMNQRTKLYLKFRSRPDEKRLSTISWAHSHQSIVDLVAALGGTWESLGSKKVTKASVEMDDQWWCIRKPG